MKLGGKMITIDIKSEENMRQYWVKKFENFAQKTELYNFSPFAENLYVFDSYIHELLEDLSKKLIHISNNSNMRLFTLLIAGLTGVLYRYISSDEIVIGTSVAKNMEEGSKAKRTILLKNDINDNTTFKQLLFSSKQEIQNSFLNAGNGSDFTLSDFILKEWLNDETAFTDFFVLFEGINDRQDIAHIRPNVIFSFKKSDENLILTIGYNRNIYSSFMIENLCKHYLNFLQQSLVNIDLPIKKINYLTEEEKNKLSVDFNKTQSDYSIDQCLHELIERQVDATSDNIAVVFEDSYLTYRQLNNKANGLAKTFQNAGIKQGDYVPVMMTRSLELPIVVLALMKLGAAYVPMDVKWPILRIEKILKDVESKIVIINKGIKQYDVKTLSEYELFITEQEQIQEQEANLNLSVSLEDSLFVIYTSGSTGEPKGAINKHRGIVNRFLYMNKRYGCTNDDVILLTSNHVFDASVWQMFWPLINRAKTIIPRPTDNFDLELMVSLIEKHKVTVTDFVPSVFNLLVDLLEENETLRKQLVTLRQLLIGGEAMRSKYIYKFKEFFPEVSITNTYGPSETSIGTIFYEIQSEYEENIPIGKPIDNVKVLILDENQQLVPIGVPGEIYLGGVCVGTGYLNDKQKTDKVFIKPDIDGFENGIYYKTGDRALYMEDGNIQFLGRIDNQVQINGIRVELREIEANILAYESIKQVVVLSKTNGKNNQYLCAYILADQKIDIEQLRNFVSLRLPFHMIPSFFIQLEEFPLNPNGKIDSKALPDPKIDNSDTQTEEFSYSETEMKVVNIWKNLLNLDKNFGIDEDFFNLGGQSLLAIKMKSKIRSNFKVDIPLVDIFKKATIRELANIIDHYKK